MDDVLVSGPYIGHGEHAGQRVFVVVGEDAGLLVVRQVDRLRHGLLVARQGGVKQSLGCGYRIYKPGP